MNDADLPEPQRPILNWKERKKRETHLFATFLIFIASYAFLHKFIVPFCLSFTALRSTPYAQIDLWFIHAALIAYLFHKQKTNSFWISFLAGGAIVYGILEMKEVFEGRYVGWLSFSRLLSSIPLALSCIFLMTRKGRDRSHRAAWAGVFFLTTFYYGKVLFPVSSRDTSTVKLQGDNTIARGLPENENLPCGALQLKINKASFKLKASKNISLEKCGLSPSVLFLEGSEFTLENKTQEPANFHLAFNRSGRITTSWNVLVPAFQSITKTVSIPQEGVAILYSDTNPASGLSVILTKTPSHNLFISRKPLSLEKTQ